jgi:hypothetical protein
MRYNDPGRAKSSSRTPRLSVIFWYVDIVLIKHGPNLSSRLLDVEYSRLVV